MTGTTPDMRVINREYIPDCPVESLIPHPHNYNKGDLGIIEESVEVNGFYGAVTARVHPEVSGHYQILAGEHRWRVACNAGAATVPVIVVAPDDEVAAARILLVDNESAKRSTYDAGKLSYLLSSLGDLRGSGHQLAALDEFEDERRANEPPTEDEDDEAQFEREFGVIVIVPDEATQRQLYQEFRDRGLTVRVASI